MLTPSWRRRTARMILVAFGASSMGCGGAPSEPAASTTSTVVSTTMAPPTTLDLSEVPKALDAAELRKLVAPVALYPDVVLSSLLPATTYPEQLADAATWLDEQGGTAHAVPEDRGWDGSVAGLLQFPDVLRWAHQNEPWTDEMGSAMTYQQGAVLDAIQRYRKDVANAGNLKSNTYQKVVQKDDDIRIQPAKPDKVYVPQYDPAAATEPQPASPALNPWIVFGGGAVVGALGAWALYSIFHDDDDGGHGGRRVRRVNNYYYSGSSQPRPRAEAWTPRRRPRARRRAAAFEPTPLRRAGTTERRASTPTQTAGVRPPGRHQGAPAPVAQPAGTPAKHHEAVKSGRRSKRGAGKKGERGAKKKGKKNGARNRNKKKSGRNGTKHDGKVAG